MSTGPPPTSAARLRHVLGPVYTRRGQEYARLGRVRSFTWDHSTSTLTGDVDGSGIHPYRTTAGWAQMPGGTFRFLGGDCSCPMVVDCKHVAALVTAASPVTPVDPVVTGNLIRGRPAAGASAAPGVRTTTPMSTTAWEQLLEPGTSGWQDEADVVPLGLLFTLRRPSAAGIEPRPSLTVRLVRPGASGWVTGNLDWRHLSPWSVANYGSAAAAILAEEQITAAKALHALVTATQPISYSTTRHELDLTDVPHPQLWAVLQGAVDVGMPLRTGRQGRGTVTLATDPAEVAIDITRAGDGDERGRDDDVGGEDAGRHLRADVHLLGRRLQPLMFVGDPAHGVVLAAPADESASARADPAVALVLAPLRRRVTSALATAAVRDEPIHVAAHDDDRFRTIGWTSLRRQLLVTSSDGSFSPPRITGPRLVATVLAERSDRLQLLWSVRYRLDEAVHDAPVDGAGDGHAPWRDVDAERQLVSRIEPLAAVAFAHGRSLEAPLGLHTSDGRLRPAAILTDLDAVDVATELLPALRAHPEVDVEVVGDELPRYRDVTDSLSVTVATREIEDERDWFDLDVALHVDGRSVPLGTVFTALAEGRTRLLLPDGGHIALDQPMLAELRALIDEAERLAEPGAKSLRISRYQADLWEQLAALGIVTGQAEAWRRQVGGLLADPSKRTDALPEGLTATLRPYQREGVGWLTFLARHGLGGILADDMGLGKTVQTLAMMLHQREQRAEAGDAAPFLVVAPSSVVHSWAEQAAQFTPALRMRVVEATFGKLGTTAADVACGADVVVTSYTRFRLDADAYADVAWAGLVLDEAQAVKNHRSKLYGCVRRLGAPVVLAITGTPMENNLMELWSLLSITAPGLFPNPSRFKEMYLTPIQRNHDPDVRARLRRRIRPLILRRTKEAVAPDLPAKQEQVLEVTLTGPHRRAYDTWLQRERRKVLGLMGDLDENRFTILRSLTVLRLASLHACLVDEQLAGVGSAKLDVLIEHLQEVAAGGHRALVFSQFTSFLALVTERLAAAGIEYVYLDGSTRNRPQVLNRFKTGAAPVFVISLKAGGVGLNLTEADYVFLLDPWWNPATEAQAIDRTHRIGQTKPVMVYRMIAADTIEEKVLALSRRKAALVDGIMDRGDVFDGKLTAADVEELFTRG